MEPSAVTVSREESEHVASRGLVPVPPGISAEE